MSKDPEERYLFGAWVTGTLVGTFWILELGGRVVVGLFNIVVVVTFAGCVTTGFFTAPVEPELHAAESVTTTPSRAIATTEIICLLRPDDWNEPLDLTYLTLIKWSLFSIDDGERMTFDI